MSQKTMLFVGSACHLLLANILLGMPFAPEDGGSMLLQNVSALILDYSMLYQKIVLFRCSACCLLLADFLAGFFDPEDGKVAFSSYSYVILCSK
jgi:hypothetical protein